MPTAPTVVDLDDGIVTAAEINAGIVALLKFLEKPPAAEIYQDVAQSVPASTWTALTFTAELWDTDVAALGGHSVSVNTSRWVCQYPGLYELGGGAGWAVSAVGTRGLYWAVNGVAQLGAQVLLSASSAFETCIPARPCKKVNLQAFDYVELFAFQSTAGALLTSVAGANAPNMSIRYVSKA